MDRAVGNGIRQESGDWGLAGRGGGGGVSVGEDGGGVGSGSGRDGNRAVIDGWMKGR